MTRSEIKNPQTFNLDSQNPKVQKLPPILKTINAHVVSIDEFLNRNIKQQKQKFCQIKIKDTSGSK